MLTHQLFGSIVIHSPADSKEAIKINGLEDHVQEQGEHAFLRFRRGWQTQTPSDGVATAQIINPLRNKYQTLNIAVPWPYAMRNTLLEELKQSLIDADASEQGSFLTKLSDIIDGTPADPDYNYAAVLNNTGTRCYFALLSCDVPIHLAAVVENDLSLHLVWSTDANLATLLRQQYGADICIYRFPVIQSRPVIINTQYVCSLWHRIMRPWDKNNNHLNLLRGLTVLEARLFKPVDSGDATEELFLSSDGAAAQ